MGLTLLFALLFNSHLTASSTLTCYVSAVGSSYNQSSTTIQPIPSGGSGCIINEPLFSAAAVSGGSSLFVQAILRFLGPVDPGLTITASASLFQQETYSQMILGGTGDATLRINYTWHTDTGSSSTGGPHAVVSDPDPSFFFNGAPVVPNKTDDTARLGACGDVCGLWIYTVDMPITFGVPFTRSWNHTYSALQQVSHVGDTREYAGMRRMLPTTFDAQVPYLQVLDSAGNPIAFSIQDVPEPQTWLMLLSGLALLSICRTGRS
jgi:hypothetical protein